MPKIQGIPEDALDENIEYKIVPAEEKTEEPDYCCFCEATKKVKYYQTPDAYVCHDCALEKGYIKPPIPKTPIMVDPILYEFKPLLEQLVQKQNFWTKGKDVRNDGPRMWDLLQRVAKILNQPIPDHVQQKEKALQGGK